MHESTAPGHPSAGKTAGILRCHSYVSVTLSSFCLIQCCLRVHLLCILSVVMSTCSSLEAHDCRASRESIDANVKKEISPAKTKDQQMTNTYLHQWTHSGKYPGGSLHPTNPLQSTIAVFTDLSETHTCHHD